ncbi:hypothetical protein [Aeromonas veronii]|uniref:hypothetical protein n=1 Tax=Aeromonas veronii TaxID=654 RepID=UPI001F47619C|nr:hypothetical protein [Aeromonas veronii]
MPNELPSRTRLSRYDKFVRLTIYALPLAGMIWLINSLNGWQKAACGTDASYRGEH